MTKDLPKLALGALAILLLGGTAWVFGELLAAEKYAQLSESQFRILQIKSTAISAFLGFFFATFIKFCFDLLLEDQKGKQAQRILAKELLAELRYISKEAPQFFSQLRKLAPLQPYIEAGDDGLRKSAEVYIATLPAPQFPVFEASIGKLGLLGSTGAELVVDTYSAVRSLHLLKQMILNAEMLWRAESFQEVIEKSKEYEKFLFPKLNRLEQHLISLVGPDN